ncbi:multicopy suppressor of BFA (Brefeldin A) [Neofusicoccum ribis]|uniref:Multicopy suppressor of BFA (Brefeldin A) n=1 Tax=Neofusicoccum ribis TaxID=45134 RepID=A0ABR3SFZ0_9PEZI
MGQFVKYEHIDKIGEHEKRIAGLKAKIAEPHESLYGPKSKAFSDRYCMIQKQVDTIEGN